MTDSNQGQTRGGADASVVFAADLGGLHLWQSRLSGSLCLGHGDRPHDA